ncbi:MAG: HD-GYP domain-containing protein, partial [Chloroflexota bacterium]
VAVLELPEAGERIIETISPELLGVAIGVCLDAQSMQRCFLNAMERLARVLESRDPYANGHSDRVARYSAELARVLGCPPDEIEQIYHAAVLHDLGKASIAAGILEKPGSLTESELETVRKHPKVGADILSTLSFLGGVTDIVRSHHEWYNGEGYNEGLRANEIPLGARIVAVADAFEAMTADRPYRRAMPLAKVIERLRKGAGLQWDANVIEALLGIIANGLLD